MTLPKEPVNDITLATFFYDAALLQQLTKNRQLQDLMVAILRNTDHLLFT